MLKTLYILMFLGFLLPLAAQTDTLSLLPNETFRVDSIKIIGNDKTEEFIILRELDFAEGDSVDADMLEFSKQRLFSLQLFYFVDLIPIKKEDYNELQIILKETWYIFPLPTLRIQDNDIAKSNYGAMLVYNNFRGRNESIFAFASFGYDPSYGISFYTPVLVPSSDISFSGSVIYQSVNNKNKDAYFEVGEDFKYKNIVTSLSVGKRLNINNEIFARSGFQYIEAPTDIEQITASASGIDRIPILGIEYVYDSRNLKQFADEGLFGSIIFDHKGFGLNSVAYSVLWLDYREYRKITDKFCAKWRVSTRNTFGENIPYYDYSYLGFSQYVRGYKRGEREGHNKAVATMEFSYPLLKDWDLSLKFPFFPRNLTSARISIYISIFAESGLTYNNGQRIRTNDFDSGYGAGLTFLFLPQNALRLEYAFNDMGRGEFILGTKLSF